MGEGSTLRQSVVVHPAVGAEANPIGDGKVEASIPVDDNENVQHHLAYPEGIGEVGACLCLVEKLTHPRKSVKGGE